MKSEVSEVKISNSILVYDHSGSKSKRELIQKIKQGKNILNGNSKLKEPRNRVTQQANSRILPPQSDRLSKLQQNNPMMHIQQIISSNRFGAPLANGELKNKDEITSPLLHYCDKPTSPLERNSELDSIKRSTQFLFPSGLDNRFHTREDLSALD